jgi:threonine 3-dehydrogenase
LWAHWHLPLPYIFVCRPFCRCPRCIPSTAKMLPALARANVCRRPHVAGVRHQSNMAMGEAAPTTLIIGAAGAVGKRLCAALAGRGHRVIASDRMGKLPGSLQRSIGGQGTCVGSIDVCDADALKALFREHADANTTVWNLAAPLSVETAMDPAVAEAVTVGGMEKVLDAMKEVGARRICFTDSIGSFGAEAPRTGATARWLTENPGQDPGSDYGRQKRGCRDLMAAFARDHSGDPRFAVLPGVLHSNAVWGNGTTEYALDALLAAPHQATRLGLPTGDAYVCPIHPDVRMPMVFVDDLMRGLIALQEADEAVLTEPQHGYCVPGLSFTPYELFAEIRKHHPGFGFRVELDENMNKFANLWPDELGTAAPLRDLGYSPAVGLADMVASVLGAHEGRNLSVADSFQSIGDGSGELNRGDLEAHVRKHLVQGREDYAGMDGQEAVGAACDKLMAELDTNNDGLISWKTFSEWHRSNSVENVVRSSINDLQKVEAQNRRLEEEMTELRQERESYKKLEMEMAALKIQLAEAEARK